jgi:hypothetical protein
VAKLTASDAQADDQFGHSVSISGDTVVVGAPREEGGPGDPLPVAGAAYVFGRDQGGTNNWGEVVKLTAGDAQDIQNFGVSVSISGDTIVVGANWKNAAYVFGRDEGGADNWGEVAKITASDAQAGDEFGGSVSISGDALVVGALGKDVRSSDPPTDDGAAYVFGRDEGGTNNWGEVARLTASDAQTAAFFGGSVSISADTLVVGAWGEDGSGGWIDVGAAYVFGRHQGGADNWGEVTKLTVSDAQHYDNFGNSVSVSGDTIAVGAWGKDFRSSDPTSDDGAAYLFGRDEGGADAWGEVSKLTASDAQYQDRLAISVSINKDTIIAGAIYEDGGPGDPISDTGAAYVFEQRSLDHSVYLPLVLQE